MIWQCVGAATLLGAAVLLDTDKDHDEVVKETANNLESKLPQNATLYVDHIDREYQNPRSAFDDLDNAPEQHIRDVVVKSGQKNSHIIEVESGNSIEQNDSEAKSQIEDFSIPEYLRVLVVPDADFDAVHVAEFEEQLDTELDGEYYVATPQGVIDLLD
ncbi:hypothetical protein C463_00345 [Halorubrum californiense DSM 19288]|uniref:Uncharacterized protein n=1 Tax=Halorubrum californiense DSM 19288 TaxID=1227465 RepID=M0EPR7_9EURY|nr:hypothetical protein [Halorubrum californiense]ELZ49043.1 hypothetical protein C463_00345 [Halorubrum californiense DSM 19288]